MKIFKKLWSKYKAKKFRQFQIQTLNQLYRHEGEDLQDLVLTRVGRTEVGREHYRGCLGKRSLNLTAQNGDRWFSTGFPAQTTLARAVSDFQKIWLYIDGRLVLCY